MEVKAAPSCKCFSLSSTLTRLSIMSPRESWLVQMGLYRFTEPLEPWEDICEAVLYELILSTEVRTTGLIPSATHPSVRLFVSEPDPTNHVSLALCIHRARRRRPSASRRRGVAGWSTMHFRR